MSTRSGMPFTTRGTPRPSVTIRSTAWRSVNISGAVDIGSTLPGQDDPHVGAQIERAAVVVAEQRVNPKAGPFEPGAHLRDGDGPERQRERLRHAPAVPALLVLLIEDGQPLRAILAHRFGEPDLAPAAPARQADAPVVFG